MTENKNIDTTVNANGAPVNGEAVITVLSDYSSAFMTLYPPQNGGNEVTVEDVMSAIALKGVKNNINHDLIKSAVQSRDYDREFKIAQADMPENGADGTITYKFSKETVIAPKENDQGFVDYKDLGLIRNIRENETIAVITPPGEGRDGTDIRGVTMKAIPGKKAPYSLGAGTKLSDDGLRIYAAFDGHICFKGNAFCVENTVSISGDVDASVGNIDFIGDIVIKGEIMEGFTVTSGKNITVNGNVTGATVKAGGNITLKKGCINSSLTAHGDITCQFGEYSQIHTDGNLNVQTTVICDVYCGGDLHAKALNGGKYTILGNTETTYLGTKNYAPTEVIAGDNALLTKEREENLKQTTELNSKIERCDQVIEFLNEKRKQLKGLPEDKEELLGNMVKSKLSCQMEKKKLSKRLSEIDIRLSQRQFRTVTCKSTVYPGVRVTIDSAVMKFDIETVRVKIYLDEDGVIKTGTV